jgi:hypothetical protein
MADLTIRELAQLVADELIKSPDDDWRTCVFRHVPHAIWMPLLCWSYYDKFHEHISDTMEKGRERLRDRLLELAEDPSVTDRPPQIRQLAAQVADALQNPETWCAGWMARDAAGDKVDGDSPSAVKWSALGHAQRLGGELGAARLRAAYYIRFDEWPALANDRHGREYVRDRLLELAGAAPRQQIPTPTSEMSIGPGTPAYWSWEPAREQLGW